jgi:hypothetical protein
MVVFVQLFVMEVPQLIIRILLICFAIIALSLVVIGGMAFMRVLFGSVSIMTLLSPVPILVVA